MKKERLKDLCLSKEEGILLEDYILGFNPVKDLKNFVYYNNITEEIAIFCNDYQSRLSWIIARQRPSLNLGKGKPYVVADFKNCIFPKTDIIQIEQHKLGYTLIYLKGQNLYTVLGKLNGFYQLKSVLGP
jgi:hypothetical protein